MAVIPQQFIDPPKMLQQIENCRHCGTCRYTCCTYYSTNDERLSPRWRLNAIADFIRSGRISDEAVESLYLCVDCGRCNTVCTANLAISGLIADSKIALVNAGEGPLEAHETMVNKLLKNRNSVSGDPDKRLNWLSDEERKKVKFMDAPGDTLLYIGCLASYVDQASAAASVKLLLAGGVDFKLMEDEFCCGTYPYNAGMIKQAEQIFTEMADQFIAAGIQRIIVPCAGCHRAFNSFYPRLLGSFDIEVLHISEVIAELIEQERLNLQVKNTEICYHDSCKLGRKGGIYEPPRQALKACGYHIKELSSHHEHGLCCGAGAGVRTVYRDLSTAIASQLLTKVTGKQIVSGCPFCSINFNYTMKHADPQKDKPHSQHITTMVAACLRPEP